MSTIEIKFTDSTETQKIYIPESSGKSRIHLVFAKNCSTGKSEKKSSDHIETVLIDDKVWYSCKICHLRFQIYRIARNHVANNHLREKSYLCNICGKSFIDLSTYNSHMKTHEDRPFQCENCPRKFATEEERKIHDDGQHAGRERKYQCGNCNKMFLQLSHLKQHVLMHSDDPPYRCKFCNKGYWRADNCSNHEKGHENDKIYTCEICSAKFMAEKYLQRHVEKKHNKDKNKKIKNKDQNTKVKKHTDEERQETVTTDVKNAKEEAQKSILNAETGEIQSAVKSVSDSKENQDYSVNSKIKKEEIKEENKTTEKVDENEGQKELIETVFTSEESFVDGINLNNSEIVVAVDGRANETISTAADNFNSLQSGAKPKKEPKLFRPRHEFICDTCGKVFKKKEALQTHIYIHTGEKPYQCEICLAKFRQKPHLQRHMLKHNGQKNEICSFCGKAFSRVEHLRQHQLRLHSTEGRASLLKHCQICDKKVQNLKKHINQVHNSTNSDKQKNCCQTCLEEFHSVDKFNRHIMNGKHLKEDEVDRTCPICMQRFNKKGTYAVKRHMINVHGKDGQIDPLMCSACHKKFIDQASFSRHACKGFVPPKPRTKRKGTATPVKMPKRAKKQVEVESETSEEESEAGEEIEIEHDGFDVLDFI